MSHISPPLSNNSAFCSITIPSLPYVHRRVILLLDSAEAALQNGLVAQAEALVRAAITDAQESSGDDISPAVKASGPWSQMPPREAETAVVHLAQRACALLVAIPGHPERGPFYLIKGLLKFLETYPWPPGGDGQIRAYLNLTQLTATLSQPKLIYSAKGVDANDVLYALLYWRIYIYNFFLN